MLKAKVKLGLLKAGWIVSCGADPYSLISPSGLVRARGGTTKLTEDSVEYSLVTLNLAYPSKIVTFLPLDERMVKAMLDTLNFVEHAHEWLN